MNGKFSILLLVRVDNLCAYHLSAGKGGENRSVIREKKKLLGTRLINTKLTLRTLLMVVNHYIELTLARVFSPTICSSKLNLFENYCLYKLQFFFFFFGFCPETLSLYMEYGI